MRRGPRRPVRARLSHAGHEGQADRGQRHGLPRGLLHPLSGELLAAALDPFALRQRAGGQHRDRRRAEGQGPRGHPRGRTGRRRRHPRHRLRLPVGDVRAKRRRALHLLRQRGLHEHRRPALRRDAARRADRQHQAGRRRAGQRLRPGQERAADRDGARDPLRRHCHGLRASRPRVQGREGDGDAGRPLSARLRPLPPGLGIGIEGHDRDRAPRQGERDLPRLRGRGRRGRRRLEDPQAGAGHRIPEAAEALRAPLQGPAPHRRDRGDPGPGRRQHQALRPERRLWHRCPICSPRGRPDLLSDTPHGPQ